MRNAPASWTPATPLAVATSAVRDAANGTEFMRRLERRCGVRTRVLTGEQEARLTLRGVVRHGRRPAPWSSATSAAAAPS